jgi:hypothetical protein
LKGEQSEIDDWIQIQITLRTLCTECRKEVLPGLAIWSSSRKAVRHLSCNRPSTIGNDKRHLSELTIEKFNPSDVGTGDKEKITELKCFICGSKTGCRKCEHLVDCQQRLASKYCICYQCINNQQDPLDGCQECFAKKSKNLK